MAEEKKKPLIGTPQEIKEKVSKWWVSGAGTRKKVVEEVGGASEKVVKGGESIIKHQMTTYKPEITSLKRKEIHPFEVMRKQKQRYFGR